MNRNPAKDDYCAAVGCRRNVSVGDDMLGKDAGRDISMVNYITTNPTTAVLAIVPASDVDIHVLRPFAVYYHAISPASSPGVANILQCQIGIVSPCEPSLSPAELEALTIKTSGSTGAYNVAGPCDSDIAVATVTEAKDDPNLVSTPMTTKQLLVLITTFNSLKLAVVFSNLLSTFQSVAQEKSAIAGWVLAGFGICAGVASSVLLFIEWRSEWNALNAARRRLEGDHIV